MWITLCIWIVSHGIIHSVHCSLQIDRTELHVHLQLAEARNAIRIRGTMHSKLNANVDTFLQPEINTGYLSCAFQDKGAHGTRINFAQSRRRLRLNTLIPTGEYVSLCNFSSIVDSVNPRARFSIDRENNDILFATTGGHGSVFPTLDRHERSVYSLSVSFPTKLDIEVLSNTRPSRRTHLMTESGSVTHVYFEDTPPFSVDELGLVLGRFQHFETASSGTEGEIDIFSREGHKRTLEIRHGDPVAISVHYVTGQRNSGSGSDRPFPAENNKGPTVHGKDEPVRTVNGDSSQSSAGLKARRHAAELTANLMTSFVDLIHAFWEIQPKVSSKLDIVLLPQTEPGTVATQRPFSFGAPGLIVLSEAAICQNKSSDRSCEHAMLKQLSRTALSGYMGCLSRPGPQTLSNAAFNEALETSVAKRMLLRLGVMSEENFVPLDVEEFQSHLYAEFLSSNSNQSREHGASNTTSNDSLREQGVTKESKARIAAKSAKFGGLLRMLEQQIGTVAFNGAVRAYLFRYTDCELPAGMDQFRECVAELGAGKRRTHRAFFHHASRFVESFVRQPGVPVLHVRRLQSKPHTRQRGRKQREDAQITLRQAKADGVVQANNEGDGGGNGDNRDDDETNAGVNTGITRLEITQRRECRYKEPEECPLGNWTIPLTVKIFSQSNAPPSFRRLVLNKSQTEIVLEDSPETSTILIDQTYYGFYRIYYDNLSDFLRLDQTSVSAQPDVALLFDYLHFAEQTGQGLADLPLLVHTVRFQSRPSRTLMEDIANKLIDEPYLRLLAVNDAEVETRLQCFYRRFPELDAEVRDDLDLARFRSMIAILGRSSEAIELALTFRESCKTLCTREAELSYEGLWSERKLLAESYITALSLRSGVERTCRQLVETLSSIQTNLSEDVSAESVSQARGFLETGWPSESLMWGSAFTASPQCLAKLLPLANAAGPEALRLFITSMARGSTASHQLLWRTLINHTVARGDTKDHQEGQSDAGLWDNASLPLSEIVLSFVKWHSEGPEGMSRTVDFLREAQQLLYATSRIHPMAPSRPAVSGIYRESDLFDSMHQQLERNQRLVRLNRNAFVNIVDSIYCRSDSTKSDPFPIVNITTAERNDKALRRTVVIKA